MPLNPLAKEALLDCLQCIPSHLQADWFIEHFESIQRLHSIAGRDKRRDVAQDLLDSLDMPLMAGGVPLRRLSVGATEWVDAYPQTWWGVKSDKPNYRLVELAVVFAMAHREQEEFSALVRPKDAEKAILAWAKKTKVAEEVLTLTASFLMPEGDPIASLIMDMEVKESSPIRILEIAEKVSEKSKVPLFSCIWEMSADNFWSIYCSYLDDIESEHNAQLASLKQSPSIETWVVKKKIALIKARRDLLKKSKAWVDEIQKPDGAKDKG